MDIDHAIALNGALLRIPIDHVQPGPNARGNLGELGDLAKSIQALGLQKPLIVCELAADQYQILDGHRRHTAARMIGLTHVDAVLRRDHGPAARIQQQLAMHTHARAFDPIAEAKALHTLMFEHNMTREQIARAVGRSPIWVRNRVLLVHLNEEEQERVANGETSIDTALGILAARRAGYTTPRERRKATKAATAAAVRTGKHCTTCRCHVVGTA
jgi:ParB family chromosome partitioning protein